MKNFLVLLVVFSLFSCGNSESEKINYAILKGKITNPTANKIIVFKGQNNSKEITLDQQGQFNDTLYFEKGFYTLRHGNEATKIYLEPEYDLNVTLDTKAFDETIKYSGNGSHHNNYIAASFINNETEKLSYYPLYTKEEDEFVSAAQKLKETKLSFLNKRDSLSDDFKNNEKKNIEFEYFLSLKRFPSYHKYYTKKEVFEPSENFKDYFKDFDYLNEADYLNVENYKNLVLYHFNEKINTAKDKKKEIENINKTAFQSLKNDLAVNMSFSLAPNNEDNSLFFEAITMLSNDNEFKDKIKKKFSTIETLATGKPSPEFTNYENHKGGTTSLKDLSGKYVYMDVWATWCGPCLREIPFLKQTEEKYHNQNIEFVSISIDTPQAYETWKKMVTDKELGGIQLLADNDWKSKFVTDYAIEGIPRFILIDPQGHIVDANAPRPSDPELVKLLDGLNI